MTKAISSLRSLPLLLALARSVFVGFLLFTQTVSGQNMWMWNQRTHPELKWQTLETEHFNIHYHQGIESIAEKGALIAEQTYQPIMDQLELDDFGKTDIVFSAEDEIMNGFAMPSNQIFIWVSQNDVAGHFGGSDKWLKMVITHEFQHVAQFQAHRTWAGIIGGASIPAWWLEGMAEYMTEVWRVGRSDSRMKIHTYRNTMNQLDAHDDGYAKVLYLAWKYGDSTLVNISKHRVYLQEKEKKYPYWYDFKVAFEDATGQTLENFDEEWRRAMNTYYYGYKAQKETPEEIGEALPLTGFSRVRSAMLAPDSAMVAVIGRESASMRDYGLYTKRTDSTQTIKEIHYGRFNGNPAWSPDAKHIIVAEYHRGSHGSLLNDLRLIDVEKQQKRWLTKDMRALHPMFSHDGKGVFFVAHPGETTQIFYQDLVSGKRVQISMFEGDVQLQNLDLSPDGFRLTFMIQDINGDVDIAVMDRDGSNFRKVTQDPEEDVYPVWTADASAIIYTSYRNSTPNLYRVDLDSLTITQMTDIAEGIYSVQRLPNTNKIIASTLADVDTIRIRAVEDDRVAPPLSLNIREPFIGWRNKAPDITLPHIDYSLEPPIEARYAYRPVKTLRPLLKLVIPSEDGLFLFGAAQDALGKHLMQGGTIFPWNGAAPGLYFNYINLEFLPAMSFYGMKDVSIRFNQTPAGSYWESRNGLGLLLDLPMNSGGSLSSNHTLQGKLEMMNRDVYEIDAGEPFPSTDEFNLGLTYSWKSQRPHADNHYLPKGGVGFLAHAEQALSSIWGDNDHSKYWVEGFFNYDIPKLPLVWFNRIKYAGQSGSILVQDALGFSERSPVYFSAHYMSLIRNTGLIDVPESYNLRGQEGIYTGNDLIYATTELRLPLFKRFPLSFLMLGLTDFSAAGFVDHGYLPGSQTTLTTWGGELRFDVSILAFPLVTLSTGLGGDADFWQRLDTSEDDWVNSVYLRMALVNPF